MPTKLRGEVLDFAIRGSQFWGVATLRNIVTGEHIKVTGTMFGIDAGDTVEVDGSWDDSPRYGRQFRAKSITTVTPADASGVIALMASRLTNVGGDRAAAMVAHFGADQVFRIIEEQPERLLEVKGIGKRTVEGIVEAYARFRGERDRMVQLKRWGLSDSQIATLIEVWGVEVEVKIRANPYALAEHVHGFGFKSADTIAGRMGLAPDAPSRLRAGLLHILSRAGQAGHVYIAGARAVAETCKELDLPAEGATWNATYAEAVKLRKDGNLRKREAARKDGKRVALIGLPGPARAEENIARQVARFVGRGAAA